MTHISKKGIPSKQKKTLLYCEGGLTVEQVAETGCEDSIWGDIQNLAGHNPRQPAPTDSA